MGAAVKLLAASALMVTGLPWSLWRLRTSHRRLDTLVAIPAPARLHLVTSTNVTPSLVGCTSPSAPVVTLPPSPWFGKELAPDLQPDVTPAPVKAGEVRREPVSTPCHDCPCCTAYATRIAHAHREIDRLRDELGRRDAAGIQRSASHFPPRAR
jgi:hypothetical protein